MLSKSVNYIFSRFFEAEKVFSQYMEKLFHTNLVIGNIKYDSKIAGNYFPRNQIEPREIHTNIIQTKSDY